MKILALVIAGFVGLLVWLFFFVIPAAIAATLFIGCLTVAGSVGVTLWTTRNRRLSDIEKDHRLQRARVYEELFENIFTVFMSAKLEIEPPSEDKMIRYMFDFNRRVILWGSPHILKSWGEFRTLAPEGSRLSEERNLEVLVALENFLLAVRKDLGHSNEGLTTGDLLHVFVNDAKEKLG